MLSMLRKRTLVPLATCCLAASSLPAFSAPFQTGNVVVYRVGDGSRALVATGNPVFLDEYTPSGTLVQSIAMPTSAQAPNKPFAGGGTATSEGWLTRSEDKRCLLVPGYGRDPAVTSGNLVSAAGLPRVVGIVSSQGSIDTSTAITDLKATANNFRGAASTDCTALWITSSLDGTRSTIAGATTSADVAANPVSSRGLQIVDGQLYNTANTGSFKGVNRMGQGLPTSTADVVRLPGLTNELTPSPYGFAFADLDGAPGVDTLYVADEETGISKFSLENGQWIASGKTGGATDLFRGLTAVQQGAQVTLYATSNANTLVKLVDASGFKGMLAGTPQTIATAGTLQAFRGVAPTPEPAPAPKFAVSSSSKGHGVVTANGPLQVTQGTSASFTVTPEPGYAVAVRGSCGGLLQGNTYTTQPVNQACTVDVSFAKQVVLFLGNSYTFGRVDPVMSYNTANVTDLTLDMWRSNPTGSNEDEPHPWGGIPGVFKKLTDQAGLDYDVSISARNAASLRGHFLNSNPAGWDLRGNAASQRWTSVVLQDLSDEPLPAGRSHNANLPYFNAYADKFEAWIHDGAAGAFTETELFGANCPALTGATQRTCDTRREVTQPNLNANPQANIYLYQTWARPDLIAPDGSNAKGTTYTEAEGLEAMTGDFHNAYFGRAADNPRYKGVSPVGDAFLRAVNTGVAMRNPYKPEAGKLNLWHTDYFHPSKYGSYLSALVHFGRISGIDPTTLGASEQAAADLGIAGTDAVALQRVAKATLVPSQPGITSITADSQSVTVQFTAPDNLGKLDILEYTATCGTQSAKAQASAGTIAVTVTGLASHVPVSCTITARNSVGEGEASAVSQQVTPGGQMPETPQPACGSAQGSASVFAPRANLCSAGTPSAVTSGNGHYQWSCAAPNTAPETPAASCSANWASTPNAGGSATASVSEGWSVRSAAFVASAGADAPKGVQFPHGFFDFVLEGGAAGSTADITITYPTALPPGAVYWKYGPTPAGFDCRNATECAQPHWYRFPGAVIQGNTVRLKIVDGGVGDDDLSANGVIVDVGGPGIVSTVEPSAATPVPTLSQWALMALACALALLAGARLSLQTRPHHVR